MIRAALILVSAVSGGLALGRKIATRELDRHKQRLIDEASAIARERIRDHARGMVDESIRAFFRRTVLKGCWLSALWLAAKFGLLNPILFGITAGISIAGFIVFDLAMNWPGIRFVGAEILRHGLRPRRIVGEMVAAQVFEEALKEIDAQGAPQWQHQIFLMVAGKRHGEVAKEIALTVSELAREASWQDLRPFLSSWAARIFMLAGLYSAFVWIVLRHVG